MKKVIALLLILFTFFTTTLAQNDCKMCGDWIGTKAAPSSPRGDMTVHTTKTFVRIKKYEDNYTVRVKNYAIDDPSDIRYWNDCKITSTSANSISFISFVDDEYDWTDTYKKGIKVHKASYHVIGNLTYSEGIVSFSYHMHVSYYNKSNELLDSEDCYYTEIKLYKNEDDW